MREEMININLELVLSTGIRSSVAADVCKIVPEGLVVNAVITEDGQCGLDHESSITKLTLFLWE